MATQACLNNIQKEGGTYCGDSFCNVIQGDINKYCSHIGLGFDVPVPQNKNGQLCYCCCSCFAYNTPIQVSTEEFRLVQDLRVGDDVMVTGMEAKGWEVKEISDTAGIAPGVKMDFMYYTVMSFDDSDVERHLITTADHLYIFLEGAEHKLMPSQDLRPGFKVLRADGGYATVQFSVPGEWSGGVKSISVGEYHGGPLDGHILNSNGVLTADFAVQSWFYSGEIDQKLLAKDPETPTPWPGSAAYVAQYHSERLVSFLADDSQWPAAFKPLPPGLINVPVNANKFFTQQQADELFKTIPMVPFGNSYRLAMESWVFRLYRGFYPDVNFIIDWQNESPNAYYFSEFTEQYIVLTGGLARLDPIGIDAMSIVMSHLLANRAGYTCVGEADYYGVYLYLREVWFGSRFFTVYTAGMSQLAPLFEALAGSRTGPDVCLDPSIKCRIEALEAGSAMQGVPGCAIPKPTFGVVSATASEDLTEVTVVFTRDLNVPSGSTPENYRLRPRTAVRSAYVPGSEPKTARLTVAKLQPNTTYSLLVRDVVDVDGEEISRKENQVTFTTPAV